MHNAATDTVKKKKYFKGFELKKDSVQLIYPLHVFTVALTAMHAHTHELMRVWVLVALVLAKCGLKVTGTRAFLHGLRQWNSLPNSIRSAVSSFRNKPGTILIFQNLQLMCDPCLFGSGFFFFFV